MFHRVLAGFAGLVLALAVFASPASAQSGGIKGGYLYSTLKFDSAAQVFNSHNGWTVGLFFGSRKDRSIGVQGELNLLQKGGDQANGPVKLYYLQAPALLRVAAGGSVRVYALTGLAFDFKIGESSPTFAIVHEWNGFDMSFVAGGGVEFGFFLIEARGTWGIKNIAKSLTAPLEGDTLTSNTFALQAGFRFK
jgi:hypothetical protein